MAGIYIHIPYCKKLCFYCDFYHEILPKDTSAFTVALLKEIDIRKEYLGEEQVNTIYFGGGTPSAFSLGVLARILDSLRKFYRINDTNEITIELNPDDVTDEYVRGLKSEGFNRISMGVQSWRDADLKFLNRRHNSAKAKQALDSCFAAGFTNISIDLIYGIPGLTPEAWESNLDISFSSGIKHLSAYHLTIEKGTVLGDMLRKNLISEVDEELSNQLFTILLKKASDAGFVQYEISNFATSGYISQHNTNYWKQVNYLGLGPSAHSFNGFSRQWNPPDLKQYISSMENGLPVFETEELDTRTKFNEYIMVSLRTMWGIDLEYVEKAFEKEGYDYIVNMSSKFRQYGLMKLEKNTLVLTDQGKMISDNIISEFMMSPD